jgi:hypothetical protein
MVHLVATLANDADYMPSLLYALRNEVASPEASSPGETWGVGYYAEERALIIRKPAELLTQRTVYEIASNVQSSIVLACVHRGAETREKAPPYRFRSWLFGYTGDLQPLSALKTKVVDKLPDFVKSDPGDSSGGHLAFAMFISELHRAGVLDDVLAGHEAYANALHRTVDAIHRLSTEVGAAPSNASFVATNGRVVVATRSGVPLYRKLQEGLEPSPHEPTDASLGEFKRVAEALKRFRAIVLARDVLPGRPGWTEIPDHTTVYIDRKLNLRSIDPTGR